MNCNCINKLSALPSMTWPWWESLISHKNFWSDVCSVKYNLIYLWMPTNSFWWKPINLNHFVWQKLWVGSCSLSVSLLVINSANNETMQTLFSHHGSLAPFQIFQQSISLCFDSKEFLVLPAWLTQVEMHTTFCSFVCLQHKVKDSPPACV